MTMTHRICHLLALLTFNMDLHSSISILLMPLLSYAVRQQVSTPVTWTFRLLRPCQHDHPT